MTNRRAKDLTVIPGGVIQDIIFEDIPEVMRVVQSAYEAHAQGRTVNPHSSFLHFPNSPQDRIIALPAHLGAPWNISGIKWIASYPNNRNAGLPRASAVLILNDGEYGFPFACLEGSVISAARTAASACLAAQYLGGVGEHVRSLGIVGTGLIASYICRFLLAFDWRPEVVRLYDTDPSAAQAFCQWICQESLSDARVADDADTVLAESQLVILTTTAGTPHLSRPATLSHHPVVLHISLRDLAPEMLLDVCNIVDDVEHVLQANTSLHLAEKLVGSRGFIAATLADVMAGRFTLPTSRTHVFSPFGLGMLDVALGTWVHDRATGQGECQRVVDFFGTSEFGSPGS